MAITKIHPIKSTLNLSIRYIINSDKISSNDLISTHMCNEKNAHIQFINTRKLNNTNCSVLARHIIQSFVPNEVTPQKAHEIGKSLCREILKNQYEYILTTHTDKRHIHNHIIFNNVSFITGKCYQSNKKTYHKIRSISDKLCKENTLSVIDKSNKKYKNKGKSYYEYSHFKKGSSWKAKLKFSIDKAIENSNNWKDFLKSMTTYGYEIKFGKHISFKHKDSERFTRSKTIGENYTEENLKKRIRENTIKELIDITNEKIKTSKSYTHWARKQNIKILSNTILEMRNQNINSLNSIEKNIKKNIEKLQDIKDKLKIYENKKNHLFKIIECINIVNTTRKNKKTKINDYKIALEFLKKHYAKIPTTKEIFQRIENLEQKKNALLKKYSEINSSIYKTTKIRKNYKKLLTKQIEH